MKHNNTGLAFLSGGGDELVSQSFDNRFFAELFLRKSVPKVLYIPIALSRSVIGFKQSYEWFTAMVSMHTKNFVEVEMWTNYDAKPLEFEKYDSIYLGGGNTYRLLGWLNKTGFSDVLKQYYKNGHIIYGGSAGAIVLGKDIRTVEEENIGINYSGYKGLEILPGNSVVCHFNVKDRLSVVQIARKIGSSIWALPEGSGLIISNENTEKVGNPELIY